MSAPVSVDVIVPARDAVVEVVTAPTSATVDIATLGPPGAKGPKGDTGAAGAKGDTGAAGATGPAGLDGVVSPLDANLVAWNYDPIHAGSSVVVSTGNICMFRVRILQDSDVDGMATYVLTAGVGLSPGQNFGAIYDKATRTLIAQTVDATTAFQTTGSWAKLAWQAGVRRLLKGEYVVAFWCRGTTGPTLLRAYQASGPVCNFNITNQADYRSAFTATAATNVAPATLPATGLTTTGAWWMGLTGTPA